MTDFKPKGPFPLFISDLEKDTRGWTGEERWQYLRLLNDVWWNGGAIEDDDGVIAEAMGLNRARKWREKVEKVRLKLVSHPEKPGFVTQARVLKEVAKVAEISQKRAAAGQKGGQQKAGAGKQMPEQMPKPPSPSPSPNPLPDGKGASAKRGTRLPPNWTPSPANIAFCLDPEQGLTEDDAARIGPRFKDHWFAQPGQRGVKLDWDATWRNWVRREIEYGTAKPRGSVGPRGRQGAGGMVAAIREVAARVQQEPSHAGTSGIPGGRDGPGGSAGGPGGEPDTSGHADGGACADGTVVADEGEGGGRSDEPNAGGAVHGEAERIPGGRGDPSLQVVGER